MQPSDVLTALSANQTVAPLGWLNVPPISEPAPSPLRLLSLRDLLLVLSFVQSHHHSNTYLLTSHYF